MQRPPIFSRSWQIGIGTAALVLLIGLAVLAFVIPPKKQSSAEPYEVFSRGNDGLSIGLIVPMQESEAEAVELARPYLLSLMEKAHKMPRTLMRKPSVSFWHSKEEYYAGIVPYFDEFVTIMGGKDHEPHVMWRNRDWDHEPSEREQRIYLDHFTRTVAAERALLQPFEAAFKRPTELGSEYDEWWKNYDVLLKSAHQTTNDITREKYDLSEAEFKKIDKEIGTWFYGR